MSLLTLLTQEGYTDTYTRTCYYVASDDFGPKITSAVRFILALYFILSTLMSNTTAVEPLLLNHSIPTSIFVIDLNRFRDIHSHFVFDVRVISFELYSAGSLIIYCLFCLFVCLFDQ